MLKVIAQDFIKLEHLNRVMPLYRELVEKQKLNRDVYPTTYLLIRKMLGILYLLKNGLIALH